METMNCSNCNNEVKLSETMKRKKVVKIISCKNCN